MIHSQIKGTISTHMRFGDGDIAAKIVSGKYEDGKGFVGLSFWAGEQGELGRPVTDAPRQDNEYPVKMFFLNRKSVDIMIDHLESLKDYFEDDGSIK